MKSTRQPTPKPTTPTTTNLIQQLKDNGQDHEFYPTTKEILDAVMRDMEKEGCGSGSVLDIGAGNGKALAAFKEKGFGKLYAIEKSSILQQQMPEEVFIIGTEFAEQSLYSKPVDVVFCNPPYGDFEAWAVKILREASAKAVYLVLPQRWEKSGPIADAIKFRGLLRPGEKDPLEDAVEDATVRRRYYHRANRLHIVGSFDFEDAEDRQARAKVHLLRADLRENRCHGKEDCSDAFERFFKEQFADLIGKYEPKAEGGGRKAEGDEDEKPVGRFPLVAGADYAEALVALYLSEMGKVERNYRLVAQLDVELLREFEISPTRIMGCLKQRLDGLRHDYWHELFSRFDKITDRLTAKSREDLLGTLRANVQVDFTLGNIHAIVLWVLKNANRYLESQFLALYDLMVDKCNVQNYKSNQKTWQQAGWRYGAGRGEGNSHYALDYRIVMQSVGGICTYERSWTRDSHNNLRDNCFVFLQDLLTVANNLGFFCFSNPVQLQRGVYTWQSNNKEEFNWHRPKAKGGGTELLFDARAFKNGNLHLRLNQKLILAMNVEHGRLKGWLRSPEEAVRELQDTEAGAHWRSHLALPVPANPLALLAA